MKKILSIFAAALALSFSAFAEDLNPEKVEGKIASGEELTMPENFVKKNSCFEVELSSKKIEKVSFGRGRGVFGGSWVELDSKSLSTYMTRRKKVDGVYVDDIIPIESFEHGLKLSKNIKVTIENALSGYAMLTLTSGKQTFEQKIKWFAGGEAFVVNNGKAPIAAKMTFTREDASEPIWIFGDSYMSYTADARWPYYLIKENPEGWFADHLSGGKSKRMIECFKRDLEHGTPKIAIWMLGMNDGRDDEGVAHESYTKYAEEFLAICKEKGIEPILTVVPSVPSRNHRLIAKWVKESGVRYIDWEEAMGVDENGNWKEGYLGKDGVHPTAEGAKVQYETVIKAVPELKK